MKPVFLVAGILGVVAAVVCAGVGVNEWIYYADHPSATGVSGVMTFFAFGSALGFGAVATVAFAVGNQLARREAVLLR
jgi:hypothetical protein